MNAREVEAKARLLFDEYGAAAPDLAARRADAFGRRAAAADAAAWRAVHRRAMELASQEAQADALDAQFDAGDPRRAGRLGRLAEQIFGASRRTA
ncbi:MAG: hypothetical protein AAF763_15760 [Pseudomonadota bacterium]